ncbi:hypothetical protein AX16_001608 [Volvariella volvacea WC 439]|nr:hypothetical protein AX16_001608 [Volvariella volvacea WC 439]
MDSPLQTTFIGVVLVLALLVTSKGFSTKKLPPGPRGLPFVGNVLDFPKEKPWLKFAEWAKQYGDMTYISLFGRSYLIINSLPIAVDLLERRGSLYSNRPILQVLHGTSLRRGMAFSQNDDNLKMDRKSFSKVMGTVTALKKYDHIGELESHKFAKRLLEKPDGFLTHAEYFAAGVIMRIAYGYEVKGYNDYFVNLIQQGMKGFSELVIPGRFLVEIIPALKYVPSWFPGAGWKTFVRMQADFIQRTIDEPFMWTKSQMESEGVDSFVSENLEGLEGAAEDLKWGAAAMYGGGGDTTVAALQSFFFAMAKYPEVQARAQAEIDEVTGRNRLPSLKDQDRLPYVRALAREVLRWHSVLPLGIPHASTEDDIYNGYFIPKGTTIFTNIQYMLHDPEVYRDPDEFNPSRFLKIEESDIPEHDPRQICFGFGRRVCPGRLLAEASIFVGCATILATFNITKSPDSDLKYDAISQTISHIKPFKCDINPRSAKAVELINSSLASEDVN